MINFKKSGETERKMSLEISNYSNILNELNKAVKMHNFYPDGHPNYESALGRCYLAVKKFADESGEVRFTIDQRGFYFNNIVITPVSPDIVTLAKKFFFRRVREVAFSQRVTLDEMKVLLSVLKLEPDELQGDGGAEALFAANDVSGIAINALKYEDLRKLKQQLEEKKHGEAEVIASAVVVEEEAPEGESAEAEEDKPQKEEKPEEDIPVATLVERIKNERDLLRYSDLSARINEKVQPLLVERKFDEVFGALLVFAEHSLPYSGLQEELRNIAAERLRSILNRDMIRYLVERAGGRDEAARVAIQKMLVFAGSEAVELLLDAIIEAPEAVTRKNLFNAIVLFGGDARQAVEARIINPEWYVVRQMVALLGELGDEQSLDAIESAYSNPDPRVKKEVMKTLVKIPSPRSTAFLIKVLDEQDHGLVSQAIISLGMLKDPGSIDVLGRIAVKWEPFDDTQDTKREAIKALGIIGDQKAVPYLTSVLFKRAWFGKKTNEEVRSLAAYSLGMIGGQDAFSAIEQVGQNSEGELYITCKRILEGREKNV